MSGRRRSPPARTRTPWALRSACLPRTLLVGLAVDLHVDAVALLVKAPMPGDRGDLAQGLAGDPGEVGLLAAVHPRRAVLGGALVRAGGGQFAALEELVGAVGLGDVPARGQSALEQRLGSRVGRPLSNSALARVVSASPAPSRRTRTWREVSSTSIRW